MTLRLQGGLGNQLFQLLAIRYLGSLHDEVKFIYINDLATFQAKRSLQIKDLLADEIITDNINFFDKLIFRTKLSRVLAPLSVHSISTVSQLKNWKSQYLDGYFQDLYSYDDLALVKKLIADIDASLKISTTPNTVFKDECAIHLRLTDFVITRQQTNFLHNYRVPYFKRSIEWFRKQGVRRFVLFSDATEQAKDLLGGDDVVVFDQIKPTQCTLLQEFSAFSSYSNTIASNSTFSFWGSLLGSTKRVIFPEKWCNTNNVDEKIFQKNLDRYKDFAVNNNEIVRM